MHSVDVRIAVREEGILLRIKDDGIPFDPKERAGLVMKEDPTVHIGIRLVFGLAEEVEYQNLLGLNVSSIWLRAGHEKEPS